jgi:phosphatidate cytidylyltransferase
LTESTPGREEPIHPKPSTPIEESRARWTASNLQLRLLTAAVLIPTILYVIFQGGLWVLATVVVVTVLGLNEFYQLIEAKGAHPLRTFGTVAGASLPVVAYVGSEYHTTILMSAVLLGLMVAQLGKARISESLASISGTFFGIFYVGWLLSHAIVLRDFYGAVQGQWGEVAPVGILPEIGIFYLIFTLAIVIAGDAGAYFTGRAYGRHKLAPKISPGKTVEGALGAVVAGVGVGLACKAGFEILIPGVTAPIGWVLCGVLAGILAVVGIVGDLVESLLKRDAEVKDTGILLPGTGGILDRVDSSLLAIPVMYYLMLAYTFFLVTQAAQL